MACLRTGIRGGSLCPGRLRGVILTIACNRGSMSGLILQAEESASTSLELRRSYFHHLTNK